MVKASVCMITYNHEKYIAQAIESVIMQKTDLDYELVIGEDCSTDRTRDICKSYKEKYPKKIKLLLQERNLGIIPNFIQTLRACDGEYIAMLEGDDYWTDPYKLQKQATFLDANPDYGLVHSDFDHWEEKSSEYIKAFNKTFYRTVPQGYVYEELLRRNFINTLTVCFRRELISNFFAKELVLFKNSLIGDNCIWLEIARKKKIAYIDEPMATYRELISSASHYKDNNKRLKFFKSAYGIRFYFIKKYGCSESTKSIVLENYHSGLLKIYSNSGNRKRAKTSYDHLIKKCHIGSSIIYSIYLFGAYNIITLFVSKIILKFIDLSANFLINLNLIKKQSSRF